ncbi:MAG: thiamine-phosphate kinase [Deltaproteobacteria bacterium]|nr:thiamine-phosphate kinase [Deltaproteobacteria bacterium]
MAGALDSEESLIDAIKALFFVAPGALELRDDAALLPHVPGRQRVVTTDVVVEGVDFDRALYPALYAGTRAMLQNLSDLGAKGAAPLGFVWSLAIPTSWSEADLLDFVRGAAVPAKLARCALYGGDVSRTSGPLVCSITAFGDVEGAPLLRSGARPGDELWLSAPLGASAAGLRRLRQGDAPRELAPFRAWLAALPELEARAVRAHLHPVLPEGARLVGHANACMDVSDGLALDAHRLAHASRARLELDALAAAVDAAATRDDALAGGEDWALLFTARGAPPIEAVRIGRVAQARTDDDIGVFVDGAPLAPRGWNHFGARR